MQTGHDPKRNTTQMTWPDRMVRARESFLDWITRTESASALNLEDHHSSTIHGENLPAHMREALDRIRAKAMDAKGAFVDYAALRQHPAYLDFRKKLSPSLWSFDPA